MIAVGQCEESLTFVNGVFKKLRRAFGMRGLNPVYAGAVAILVIGLILTTINIHRLRYVLVNLCQNLLFLHQLTQNMTKACSLIYQFLHENYKLRTCCVHSLFLF